MYLAYVAISCRKYFWLDIFSWMKLTEKGGMHLKRYEMCKSRCSIMGDPPTHVAKTYITLKT